MNPISGRQEAIFRNREPILAVLQRVLPTDGLLLEIASGTGEHAVFMVPRLPEGLKWQPSDVNPAALSEIDSNAKESGRSRIRPALRIDVCEPVWPVSEADAIFCCNMLHVSPLEAAVGLFKGARRVLKPGGPLVLYGPYKRHGAHTAPSNETFDAGLRARDSRWGVRCLDTEIVPLAEHSGFALDEIVQMPANNLMLVFR